MRLIIAGSRSFKDSLRLRNFIQEMVRTCEDRLKTETVLELVCGCAEGIDRIAGHNELWDGPVYRVVDGVAHFPVTKEDWRKTGRSAGLKRNEEMVRYANEIGQGGLLALWDGQSNGTRHMVKTATESKMKVWLITLKQDSTEPNTLEVTSEHFYYGNK